MGVTVRLAGPLRVERGSPPEALRIGSPKERRLLALLAARRPAVLTGDQLAEELWDGSTGRPPRHPAAGVATLVSRLRSRLDPDILLGDRCGYRLGAAPDVTVDLDEAARLLDEADRRLAAGAAGLAASAAARALELLGTGEPLPEEADEPWVVAARAEWRELVRRARHTDARAALGTGDADRARRAGADAVAADRFDETAHRLLMRAHQLAGEPSRAVEHYHRLRTELADELGVEPAPRTREEYLALLRDQGTGRDGPAPRAGPPSARHCVGRTDEIARLTRRWDAATRGRSGLVLLAGEAGIGKTRLAAEVTELAAATGGRVASARCHAAERSLFLQPLVDALGPVLAALPGAVAGGRPPRAGAGGPVPGPRARRVVVARAPRAPPGVRRARRPARRRHRDRAPAARGRRPAQRRPGHRRAAALPRPASRRRPAPRVRDGARRGGRDGARAPRRRRRAPRPRPARPRRRRRARRPGRASRPGPDDPPPHPRAPAVRRRDPARARLRRGGRARDPAGRGARARPAPRAGGRGAAAGRRRPRGDGRPRGGRGPAGAPGAGDRPPVRAGRPRTAAGPDRGGVRVRERPGARGAPRQHARARAPPAPPARGRPAVGDPGGGRGPRRGGRGLAAGGARPAPRGRGRRAPGRDGRRRVARTTGRSPRPSASPTSRSSAGCSWRAPAPARASSVTRRRGPTCGARRRRPARPATGASRWRCCASSAATCRSRWASRPPSASRTSAAACGGPRRSGTAWPRPTSAAASRCWRRTTCGSARPSTRAGARSPSPARPAATRRCSSVSTASRPPTPTRAWSTSSPA